MCSVYFSLISSYINFPKLQVQFCSCSHHHQFIKIQLFTDTAFTDTHIIYFWNSDYIITPKSGICRLSRSYCKCTDSYGLFIINAIDRKLTDYFIVIQYNL